MKKLENMSEMERREFLKYFSAFIGLPFVSQKTRTAMTDLVFGSPAFANDMLPVNFIEINFRDQWDFQCLFVPPGIAQKYADVKARIPDAGAPIAERSNFYITPNATELRPHLDNIAVLEVGEVCVGSVHAHEAANPLRSPGRSYTPTAGKLDMATVDLRPGGRVAGNEVYYSSTPTPMILHNYYQKSLTPNLTNGVILRSSLRTGVHTYYHFEGNLANAQADRYFDKVTLLNKFSGTAVPTPSLTSEKHGELLSQILNTVDEDYLKRVKASQQEISKHRGKLQSLGNSFQSPPASLSLALNSTEQSYWTSGIGQQVICAGDNSANCKAEMGKWHPGELFAYAGKLLKSNQVRSVAIDFDMSDVHTNRTKFMMDTQAQQSGMTLARLIQYLKSNNLWQNTVIAMYTLDGSRSPESNSTGQNSKNAVVLAGGRIKGGYYGDIRFADGKYSYHRPDDAGNPISVGVTDGSQRVSGADVYKTVMTAAGIPMSLLDSFPDVKGGKLLSYLLKT